MKNGIYHSAEGSTWTKKNHKYIRKEGNRYIYPEDVKKSTPPSGNARDILRRQGIKKVSYRDFTFGRPGAFAEPKGFYEREEEAVDRHGRRSSNIVRYSPRYDANTSDSLQKDRGEDNPTAAQAHTRLWEKKLTSKDKEEQRSAKRESSIANARENVKNKRLEQAQNRKAAANGQVVNPIATWRGSDGRVIAREKTNDKISTPTASDYKKYSQLRGGASNRSKAMNKQESANYKQLSKQQSRKKALNSQGSSNRQQEAKDSKEYQNLERAESKRKAALNNQGKNDRQDQTKHTLYEKRLVEKVEKEQKETEKPIIEKKEKETILKEQSPSENKPKKKTNKALEKGKKALDAIKSKLSKKKRAN